jgi:hypothetical protein
MFLLRSAFWLTVAFIMLAPHDVDLRQKAEALSSQAVAAGQDLIVAQMLSTECTSIECVGGKAMLAAVTTKHPSIDRPMQDTSITPVPIPRPRPDWMG